MRQDFETLGATWPFDQVGTKFVRIAGQMTPRMYAGFRLKGTLQNVMDTGPKEYISLYTSMWPSFTTTGAKARAIIDRLPAIELDSEVCPGRPPGAALQVGRSKCQAACAPARRAHALQQGEATHNSVCIHVQLRSLQSKHP
jgi:hypothetical protein